MPADDTKTEEQTAEAQEQAEFEAGAAAETPAKAAKPDTKPDPKADTKADPDPAKPAPAAKPKYIQLTEEQFTRLDASANKTAALEAQMSKAFGTMGNQQKVIAALQSATPRGFKVEIPKDAFAGMEKDFPELAAHTRAALEATMRGLTGTASADIDPENLQRLVSEHTAKLRADAEIESLEEDYPDWHAIVGAVSKGVQPDANNPYRKWLATKDEKYQAKLNGTNKAAVIARSIELFQTETKAPPKVPSLKDQLQKARIEGAVKPRGDGGQASPSRTDDDDFEAGYAAR